MATPLDPRFICSGDIESFFVDKLTALPLSAGVINFYIDNTNTGKSVYKLTGSPGSYAFVSLGTSITLNSAGEYQDNGNPIVIYYFPYHCAVDGDPTTSTGVLELYSVAVFNSGSQQQYTRSAWPPLASNLAPSGSSSTAVLNLNYIPNGQFLSHNNHPITDPVNTSPNTITEIAQGGWSFKESAGGTGTYTVSFVAESLNNFPTGLTDAPPFSALIVGTSGTETIRDLTIQWPNVNTFSNSSSPTTNVYNLLLAAESLSGTTQTFNVYLISNFGSGGSTEVDTLIGSITLPSTATYTYFNLPITMPNNSSFITGDGNYIAIAVRMPSGPVNAKFTDFALTVGSATRTSYPVQTPAQSLSEGVAGWMPTPDPSGMDLYLPLILTSSGMKFDDSIVGQIITKTQITALPNELAMTGTVNSGTPIGVTYVSSAYNAVTGIPYQRLMNYLLLNSPAITIGSAVLTASNVPMFGTGFNFVTIYSNSGAPSTTFFININFPNNGGSASSAGGAITIAATHAQYYYTATVHSVPTASYFWTFVDGLNNNTYNVWYSVNGIGTPPATPTGANIKVSILSSFTIVNVINATIVAINQYQFMVPNLAGLFLRSVDPTGLYDIDYQSRVVEGIAFDGTFATSTSINYLGSLETAAFLQHTHSVTPIGNADAGGGTAHLQQDATSDNQTSTVFNTGNSSTGGGTETRPVNYSVNYFIKY